jgi:Deoxyribodipyrimidine photolyase
MPKGGIQTFIPFKVSAIAIVLLVMLSARRVSSLSSTMSSKATKKPQPQPTALPLHIHWFRQDLRLLDNPALNKTIKNSMFSPENDISKGIIPIYCFDPRFVGGNTMTPFGSQKCGVIRAKFLLDSVIDLRKNLEKKGSGLVVAYGKPEEVLSKLCKALQGELAAGKDDSEKEEPAQTAVLLKPSVVVQEEPASEEYQVDKAVQRAIKTFASGSLESVWAATLYDLEDLPFDNGVQGMPDTFTPFRNKVEKVSKMLLLCFFFCKERSCAIYAYVTI